MSYLIYRFPLSTRELELSLNLSRGIFNSREEFFFFFFVRPGDLVGLNMGRREGAGDYFIFVLDGFSY